MSSITLQKNVTFHLAEGNNGQNTSYFSYPTLPNSKATFRLCGCFWSYKYYFEQPTNASSTGTKIESDACQMWVIIMLSPKHFTAAYITLPLDTDVTCLCWRCLFLCFYTRYLYLTRTHDHSDIEFQLYCDSGSKANVGGWTLAQMKWASVKISFISPETKSVISHKSIQ